MDPYISTGLPGYCFLSQPFMSYAGGVGFCLLMGDFNINLLNGDSHSGTEDFVNTLGSHAFHPQILKPTRIANHSTTPTDNIFFNSLEHHYY